MDAILDLTARAVSLIVLIQDSLIKYHESTSGQLIPFSLKDNVFKEFTANKQEFLELSYFTDNGVKITYISMDEPECMRCAKIYCFQRCCGLIDWISKDSHKGFLSEKLGTLKSLPSPEKWRDAIRELLYIHPSERVLLANQLHYMPLQVVLACGAGKYNARQQRLLQIWGFDEGEQEQHLNAILSQSDEIEYHKLKPALQTIKYNFWDKEKKLNLLDNEKLLLNRLEDSNIPLSFLNIFDRELDQICLARKKRVKEIITSESLSDPLIEQDFDACHGISFEEIFSKALDENSADNDLLQFSHQAGKAKATPDANTSPAEHALLPDDSHTHDYNKDALKSAKDMELWALAFSGGGIRSATFGLGVLQGLAKRGLLSKFDYLSTVSGGGYLGSWLVSWICRNHSVVKVSDRLNPEKSSDPFGEEVRPIRWLRMYSNYLAPTTGIMSTDSWTVGMTLIRNMLINQMVLLGLILTLVGVIKSVFLLWSYPFPLSVLKIDQVPFNVFSGFFLFTAALMAGLGMRSYHLINGAQKNGTRKKQRLYIPDLKKGITLSLQVIGVLAAFLFSSWLYHHAGPLQAVQHNFINFYTTAKFFGLTTAFGAIAMLLIYFLGRYDVLLPKRTKIIHLITGITGTIVAAICGGLMLTTACFLAQQLMCLPFFLNSKNEELTCLAFTLLPPLTIEIMSITVVLRMALLGKNFPDERREWWGRIGGEMHRLALVWIVVCGTIFLGAPVFNYFLVSHDKIKDFFIAGWGATLLAGLKAAYANKTSGEKKPGGTLVTIMEGIALVAPYVFGIGILMYVPSIWDTLFEKTKAQFNDIDNLMVSISLVVAIALLTVYVSRRVGVNQFSMHLFYRNRLVRAFLGATRLRHERQKTANPYTGFDPEDDIDLKDLFKSEYFGPYPLINTTLNATGDTVLDRQDRKAESFIFSPGYCGFDFSRTRPTANILKKSFDYAYRPTHEYSGERGPKLGTAMTISGAAANPNQGYHSNTATAFLLTLFNVRLGWWIGNPRKSCWKKPEPTNGLNYIVADLVGKTSTMNKFLCLSDGGHFDNMGLYELVRRKCKYIVLCDGEQDDQFTCEGLANAIRRCRIDFGVEITLAHLDDITSLDKKRHSKKHYTAGTIYYPEDGGFYGTLIYIKSSLTDHVPVDVREYAMKNKAFPHQSTGDQFFDEAQFESYRKLGLHIAEDLFDNH